MHFKIFALFVLFSSVSTRHSNKVEDVFIPCLADENCDQDMPGSRCVEEVCVCESPSGCVAKILNEVVTKIGESCRTFSECRVDDSYCNMDGVCACRAGSVPSADRKTCLKAISDLGTSCLEDAQCVNVTENSRCTGGVCACKSPMRAVGNNCLLLKGLGEDCSGDEECSHLKFTRCLEGQCACEFGYVSGSKKCVLSAKTFKSSCMEDVQCTSTLGNDSICSGGVCTCKDSYQHKSSSNKCVRDLKFGDWCTKHEDCHEPETPDRLECANEICWCKSPYKNIDDECVYSSSFEILLSPTVIVFVLFAMLL